MLKFHDTHLTKAGQEHPVATVVRGLWPVLEAVSTKHQASSQVFEKLCRFFKHSMRACKEHFEPLLKVKYYRPSMSSSHYVITVDRHVFYVIYWFVLSLSSTAPMSKRLSHFFPVDFRPATHSAPRGNLQRGSSLSVLVLRFNMRLGVWREGAGVRRFVVPDAGGLRPGSVPVSPCTCSSVFGARQTISVKCVLRRLIFLV